MNTIPLAHRYESIADPTVTNLLSLSGKPGIISFAGGTPAETTFPREFIQQAATRGDLALQYSPAQGTLSLRTVLAERLSVLWERAVSPESILITSGSQQALDLIGRTFIDPSDIVLCEDPTYFVALYAFSAYAPTYKPIDWKKPRRVAGAKLAYAIPTFHNPTGTTLTQIERQVIGESWRESQTLLIEDDPYSELYFGRRAPKPIIADYPHNIIYITSLSKIMGPALRIGVVVGQPEIITAMTRVKTGMDLCTSALTQGIAERVLAHPEFGTHLERTRKYYARQARCMLGALKRYMPKGVIWSRPQGGMFVWVILPSSMDSAVLYKKALSAGVAFVPGYIFSPSKARSDSLRLSFSTASEDEIERGIKILAELITREVR